MSACDHQWTIGVARDGQLARWCGHCGAEKRGRRDLAELVKGVAA